MYNGNVQLHNTLLIYLPALDGQQGLCTNKYDDTVSLILYERYSPEKLYCAFLVFETL